MKPEIPAPVNRFFKKGLRCTASLGIGLGSVLSPVDSPINTVNAESNLQQNSLTLLHGDGSRARLNIMLLPYNGTTTQMLQEVAEDIFLIPPTNEFKNKVNVYTTIPLENLNCKQNADCDYSAIYREVNRVVGMGIIPQETLVVIKSNEQFVGAGLAGVAGRSVPPDIYTFSQIVRPEVIAQDAREFRAADIAHELWGHTFAGFLHEGNDIMASPRVGNFFNDQHTQFLRAHFALAPYNYVTPKNEIKVTGGSLSLEAELITHIGTTQQKRWIIPANNDGPDITLLRNPESVFEVPAPQIGVGNYILLPDMTYTWREWSSAIKTALPWTSPEWDRFEGWPGIFFPNTPAEIKVKTPKRDSTGIGFVTLAGGQETTDLTPTLTWNNRDQDVFYYEVQLSKDSTFNTNPATATASVYWNLVHGGESKPLNSYTVPDNFPLEKDATYFWRVRPRIQGDGTPVAWSETFRFSTPATLKGVRPDAYYGDKDKGIIGPSAEDLKRWGQDNDDAGNDNAITVTLVQEVEGPGGIKEVVSYPHIIPIDNQAVLPKREEELTPAG